MSARNPERRCCGRAGEEAEAEDKRRRKRRGAQKVKWTSSERLAENAKMPSRLRLADRAAMARKKARDESTKSVATAGFSTMLRRPVPGAVGAPK